MKTATSLGRTLHRARGGLALLCKVCKTCVQQGCAWCLRLQQFKWWILLVKRMYCTMVGYAGCTA